MSNVSHHMRVRSCAPFLLPATGGVVACSAGAAVINQRAVAETYIAVFVGFALLLMLVVLGLVAAASSSAFRARRLRRAAVVFASLAVVAAVVLLVLREARAYSTLEGAFLWCAGSLVLVGVGLAAHAFVSARRGG
jgi:hypothetical protein